VQSGLTSCKNCSSIFQANQENRLLSVAWALRKSRCPEKEKYRFLKFLTEEEVEFIYHHVVEEGYSHDDFLRKLRQQSQVA